MLTSLPPGLILVFGGLALPFLRGPARLAAVVAVPLLLVGLMWFMNRGEKKRRAELEEKLKKGDRVLTRSGIVGKVLELGDSKVKIEIAPGVNVTMTKQSIEGLDEGGDIKSSKKSSDKDRDGKKNKK